MDRKEETKIVKKVLKSAGVDVLSVGHGHGTSRGWLYIRLAKPLHEACEDHGSIGCYNHKDCDACVRFVKLIHETDLFVTDMAQKVTNRHGDYDGRIRTTWD